MDISAIRGKDNVAGFFNSGNRIRSRCVDSMRILAILPHRQFDRWVSTNSAHNGSSKADISMVIRLLAQVAFSLGDGMPYSSRQLHTAAIASSASDIDKPRSLMADIAGSYWSTIGSTTLLP
jgi:hypothetical protein